MSYQKVTIVGGGTLGSQIAFMSAFYNKDVTIWGRKDSSIDRAKERVNRWAKDIQKDLNKNDAEIKNAKAHLSYTTDLSDALKGADLVIEALPENPTVKKDFYAKFKKLADKKTVLATNTSTLLPSVFMDETGRPEKYIAYHFANTIWKNNTAEIMPTSKTDKKLPATFEEYSREIGMVPLMINKEQPGYILNSLLVPFLNAGAGLWVNDIAKPETIDKTWMIATGSPKGPFAIMDIVGIRTMYAIISMNKSEESQKIAAKFKKMIDDGKIGIESGEGFYKYPNPDYEKVNFLN